MKPVRRSRRNVGVAIAVAVLAGFVGRARAEEAGHHHHPPAHVARERTDGIDHSAHADHSANRGKIFLLPADCGEVEVWDPVTAMCMPYPTGTATTHAMLHGNVFGVGIAESGPRGRNEIVSTQMVMANVGRTIGQRHYLNLGVMATAEKWTLPDGGYPLILQTGEANRSGTPYIDAQHPHSSPIMGLGLSDTIRLDGISGKDHLRLFFAPRGQSTDGPIVFMHRPTGTPNPDAPLGHHIGQDVGHITSTVVGSSLRLGDHQFEASAFNGEEPEPDEVNLPLGTPNSAALRYIRYFSDRWIGMASIAYVDEPHPHAHGSATAVYDEAVTHLVRYSASAYSRHRVLGGRTLYNTFIYGSYRTFGVDTLRHSFAHEFHLQANRSSAFGRSEILQRVPAELRIAASRPLDGRWVAAFTLGYSHALWDFGAAKLSLGASGTKSFVPRAFADAYGGNPWSGKVFLQLSGMEMWAR